MLSSKDIPLFFDVISIVFISLSKLELGSIQFLQHISCCVPSLYIVSAYLFVYTILYSFRGLYKNSYQVIT